MNWPSVDMYLDWKGWAAALMQKLAFQDEVAPGQLTSFSKDKLPSAEKFHTMLIYVNDATGGAVPAYSDGTDWRRVTDGTIIN